MRHAAAPCSTRSTVLHGEHCFHRDIAPDNILILDDGRPLLLDFGAARRVIGDMTQALTAILKPGYAPIEQYAEIAGREAGSVDRHLRARRRSCDFAITGKPPPDVGGADDDRPAWPLSDVARGPLQRALPARDRLRAGRAARGPAAQRRADANRAGCRRATLARTQIRRDSHCADAAGGHAGRGRRGDGAAAQTAAIAQAIAAVHRVAPDVVRRRRQRVARCRWGWWGCCWPGFVDCDRGFGLVVVVGLERCAAGAGTAARGHTGPDSRERRARHGAARRIGRRRRCVAVLTTVAPAAAVEQGSPAATHLPRHRLRHATTDPFARTAPSSGGVDAPNP